MPSNNQQTAQDEGRLPYELWEAFDPERIVQCEGCGRQLVAPVGHEPCDSYCCVDCYKDRKSHEIEDGLDREWIEDRYGDG